MRNDDRDFRRILRPRMVFGSSNDILSHATLELFVCRNERPTAYLAVGSRNRK